MPPASSLPANHRARERPAAWAAAVASPAAGPALAMPAAGAESAGFWFFACTALMLVAVLAFALGRARGAARRDRSAGQEPAQAAPMSTPQIVPVLSWLAVGAAGTTETFAICRHPIGRRIGFLTL